VANYVNGYMECGTRLLTNSPNAQGGCNSTGTVLAGAILTGDNTTGSAPSQIARNRLYFVAGMAADNYDINYHRVVSSDTATRRRGTFSVKFQPKVANTAITYTFVIPAVSGIAQSIKGSLRFDSTYGTATPPIISLSGQGVTQSYTCATLADTWDDFILIFTPSNTGDITVTITVQSTNTTGYAWLDGVYHYPMIQSVRHWGYQWLPQAAQLVDSRITLSESAALALPVVSDHTAHTLTISGPVNPSELLQASLVSLCQTTNNSTNIHCSLIGPTFTTSYTVVLTGSGEVLGAYTDSSGTHVKISNSNILNGSRVQIYNVTDSVELSNSVLSSSGLSFSTIWTANKTIRVRATKLGYLPLEYSGILTSGGFASLETQKVDTVYNNNSIDGSTVTGITDDDTNIQIDVSVNTTVQNIYAWMRYYETQADGIVSPLFMT
jgi:hypothetical protein